ncbi:pyridoxal phosphate phosphatase PHOSPHO2-like [Glandiceps talaboti]
MMATSKKILLVCDFDNTIINGACDWLVTNLMPGVNARERILQHYRLSGNWSSTMQEIYKSMRNLNITPNQMIECLHTVNVIDGMRELLEYQSKQDGIDFILMSGCNTVLINVAIEGARLKGLAMDIIANPAKFNDEGYLEIENYHTHDCDNCSTDMCKRIALKDYREKQHKEGIVYDRVCYVGDGGNDFCPSQSLCESDIVFPRVGFALMDKITQFQEEGKSLNARVVPWVSGQEVLDTIKTFL